MKTITKITSLLALGSMLTSVSQAQLYSLPGSGLPASIPDSVGGVPGSLSVTFTLPSVAGPVGDIWLSLDMAHTWVGDLAARLSAPGGGSFTVFDRVQKTQAGSGFGDSSNLDGVYTFKDSAAGDFWAAALGGASDYIIPGGEYRTSAALTGALTSWASDSGFVGLAAGAAEGTWTLTITDNAAGDLGTLRAATLHIQIVPEPTSAGLIALGLALFAFRKGARRAAA